MVEPQAIGTPEGIAMGYHRISIGLVAAALVTFPLQGSRADTTPKVIEEVDFAISCGPSSQQAFKHAVWTLHSFWYPEALEEFNAIAAFAAAGLDAAICYSKIAPDVPHALHMPSHIFTRLGMWQQSIGSNRDAHSAALNYVHKTLAPGSYDQETLHTMDYLEYAYLQIAQDGPAKEVLDELMGFRQSAGPNLAGAYAVAAIPVRYALERRDWPAAAALSEPAIGFPLERFPWAEAMIAYARALGNARTGNVAAAEGEISRLQSLEDKLKGNDTYWANQVEVQRLAAAGILAHVQGDDKKAIALVRAAAELDGTMDKHPATPSSVLPARELLADLLLELDQPAAALVEYRAMLRTDPP
ncbi:MAG: hypothetical protein WAM77_26130 [Xanthobacteraceae bacterium]